MTFEFQPTGDYDDYRAVLSLVPPPADDRVDISLLASVLRDPDASAPDRLKMANLIFSRYGLISLTKNATPIPPTMEEFWRLPVPLVFQLMRAWLARIERVKNDGEI